MNVFVLFGRLDRDCKDILTREDFWSWRCAQHINRMSGHFRGKSGADRLLPPDSVGRAPQWQTGDGSYIGG